MTAAEKKELIKQIPVLIGKVDKKTGFGKFWCPICKTFHSHGMFDPNDKKRNCEKEMLHYIIHKSAHCGNYPLGYFVCDEDNISDIQDILEAQGNNKEAIEEFDKFDLDERFLFLKLFKRNETDGLKDIADNIYVLLPMYSLDICIPMLDLETEPIGFVSKDGDDAVNTEFKDALTVFKTEINNEAINAFVKNTIKIEDPEEYSYREGCIVDLENSLVQTALQSDEMDGTKVVRYRSFTIYYQING
jgi:hypothetical protein